MLKIIGSLMLVAAGGVAGMMVAREYAKRPGELKALLSAIQMLETEIMYTATPMVEAMERVASGADRRVAGFFRDAALDLKSMAGRTAGEAWEAAMDRFYPRCSLSRGDMSILGNLGRALGRSDREDQAKHLRLASEQIKMEIIKSEEDASKNTKMWNYLGFCGALAAVIILY